MSKINRLQRQIFDCFPSGHTPPVASAPPVSAFPLSAFRFYLHAELGTRNPELSPGPYQPTTIAYQLLPRDMSKNTASPARRSLGEGGPGLGPDAMTFAQARKISNYFNIGILAVLSA